jgi:lipopolysaccharide/colanic/teichoic acid biosynthesis glycosyltransferase
VDGYRRTFDLVASLLLILLTLPVGILMALGSAASLRAWPLFTQQRVGRDGQVFGFIKIRTLPPSVPSYLDKHRLDEHDIPAFCRFLRRSHLDELPQLFLVLIGRMSLVGPRPEMAWLHEEMPRDFASARTSVRPGCTGLWQVSDACTELIGAAPEYDRFYLQNRSVRLDLWVVARTVLKMAGLGRLITLERIPTWTLGPGRNRPLDAAPIAVGSS